MSANRLAAFNRLGKILDTLVLPFPVIPRDPDVAMAVLTAHWAKRSIGGVDTLSLGENAGFGTDARVLDYNPHWVACQDDDYIIVETICREIGIEAPKFEARRLFDDRGQIVYPKDYLHLLTFAEHTLREAVSALVTRGFDPGDVERFITRAVPAAVTAASDARIRQPINT